MQRFEGLSGLTAEQVADARREHGQNKIELKRTHPVLHTLLRAFKEPMLILLMMASAIYFITGAHAEGFFMVFAIVAVSFISFYQESRSNKALEALKAYAQPKTKVIREGVVTNVATEELVPGDLFVVEEGVIIPSDGTIIRANDFSVNESILTGESMPVNKAADSSGHVFRGTIVTSGLAICEATATGLSTRVGKIGKSLENISQEKTPLQVQVEDFVRKMAIAGAVIFVIIWIINYLQTASLLDSLMKSLTLAMSILPEEIPVAFATFMALGGWRLTQLGIIVKQTQTVETLGSATVICLDKTGTLTKNEMSLVKVYDFTADRSYDPPEFFKARSVIACAKWASEPIPFDPMEKALHRAYADTHEVGEEADLVMTHEYMLGGVPPLMTHVYEDSKGRRRITAKGAPEAFLKLCKLKPEGVTAIRTALDEMTQRGFRVLGVADVSNTDIRLPRDQQAFDFTFRGLVAFYDPPKENIPAVLEAFYDAGIRVKVITGDNTLTTQTIAKQINLKDSETALTGEQVSNMSETALRTSVERVNLFTRMFPEAKLKVIEALKKNEHVVAMTGDGVNDGPALKAAHIGIAMGSRGTEVAKQASALVLSKDDLTGMVEAISMGRKIYSNLKKAIQYIVSIHIPAILIVFLPLVLAWPYPAIFTPVHIIFLELIMGPTCSIIYENEPIEKHVMLERPRSFTKTFFRISELLTSIIQGLAITTGLVLMYWYAAGEGASLTLTTSMVFVTLITANILLTLTNRSFEKSMLTTLKYRNPLIPGVVLLTILTTGAIFMAPMLREFFGFELLSGRQLLVCVVTGAASVLWFEGWKWLKRRRNV